MAFVLSKDFSSLDDLLAARAPHQPEFVQTVTEVAEDIIPIIHQSEAYKDANIFERLIEPERLVKFSVAWQNDVGQVEVNRGYRVQFNAAMGPYKGGLRFHPSVNESVLKFLGFEQTFKNALTGLPMGGGKGGSDFNPKGRSEAEIMRFCNAFMQGLYRHIGPNMDVPAGDINVGAREIGYLFGAYRRITGRFEGVLTGKGLNFGGSELRTEATGYGVMYFLREMLRHHDSDIEGQSVMISGAGNVASYTARKALEMGAKVITLSDSSGRLYDEEGLTPAKLDGVARHKASGGGFEDYVQEFGGEWTPGAKPWDVGGDIAIPCATQNEIEIEDAKAIIKGGAIALVEGANMPCTNAAQQALRDSDVLFGPAKAANAGGVAVSGLEISQDRQRRYMRREKVDETLQEIMRDIHGACVAEGLRDGKVDYAKGANIAGFRRVADAMVAQGVG